MATLYEVRNWDELYENAGSRKIRGPLDWLPLPTKHDGRSYRRLMKRKDALEMYGAWVLILAVAAKCKKRGTLSSADGPLTAECIALKTGANQATIEKALQLFSSDELKWLTGSTLPTHPDAVVEHPDTLVDHPAMLLPPDKTGQDRIGPDKQDRTEPDTARPEPVLNGSAFAELTEADLKDTPSVVAWIERQQTKKRPIVGASESDRINVVAAAVKAMQIPDACNRVAVFAGIVTKRLWQNLSCEHEDEARRRLAAFERSQRGPPDPAVAKLESLLSERRKVMS